MKLTLNQHMISLRYRRMQRFFSEHRIDYDDVAWFIMRLFGFTDSDYYLSLDRTNWKWGKADINLLAMAVVYQSAAIPYVLVAVEQAW